MQSDLGHTHSKRFTFRPTDYVARRSRMRRRIARSRSLSLPLLSLYLISARRAGVLPERLPSLPQQQQHAGHLCTQVASRVPCGLVLAWFYRIPAPVGRGAWCATRRCASEELVRVRVRVRVRAGVGVRVRVRVRVTSRSKDEPDALRLRRAASSAPGWGSRTGCAARGGRVAA